MAAPLLTDAPQALVPPLQNGDRLSQEEFERRWDLHPEIKKAELIDGQVYVEMTSPFGTANRTDGRPPGRGYSRRSTPRPKCWITPRCASTIRTSNRTSSCD